MIANGWGTLISRIGERIAANGDVMKNDAVLANDRLARDIHALQPMREARLACKARATAYMRTANKQKCAQ